MSKIISEAIEIFHDLKDVVVIGAVAVMLHTKKARTSFDVDVAVTGEISDDFLGNLGYIRIAGKRDSWNTPRGGKVDLFRKDVSGIPVTIVTKSAVELTANSQKIKAASIEVLIVSKYRAFNSQNRPGDLNDLHIIARKKFDDIRWDFLRKLTKNDVEYKEIEKVMRGYRGF